MARWGIAASLTDLTDDPHIKQLKKGACRVCQIFASKASGRLGGLDGASYSTKQPSQPKAHTLELDTRWISLPRVPAHSARQIDTQQG
jgi:hypothetical protein